MNAGVDHIKHVAARLGTLATALATKIARPDEHAAMLKGVAHALAALAIRLTPDERLQVRDVTVLPAWDMHAASLLCDRELVYALGQVTPRESSTAYLYLRAFHQWNAVVKSADEEQMFREFALALIVATFFIETRTDRRPALEEVAYKVLGYDPALREVLPPLREAFERAMRV